MAMSVCVPPAPAPPRGAPRWWHPLGTVWVLADAYEQDLGLVQVGATVSVRVPAYPGETFAGKVVHVHDTVDPDTRTDRKSVV